MNGFPMEQTRRSFLRSTAQTVIAGAALASSWAKGENSLPLAPGDSLVASTRFLGNQFLENSVNVTGADGATSTLLPTGESLWLFGDTVEGPFETIRGMNLTILCSNTAAIVPKQDVSRGIKEFRFLAEPDGKRPRQLVPYAADEDRAVHRVWAVHGVCVGQKIYLFSHRITLLKNVEVFLNFQLDGMGISRANLNDLNFARLTAPDGTREFWKGDQPSFGVFIEQAKDYVYLWGSFMTGMYLARTRPEDIEGLNSYEYLAAAPTLDQPDLQPRWSKTWEPTAVLFDSVPNEMSAAYNRHLRKYVAFHSFHREHKIVMRTAPQITGPWSAPTVVFEPERIKDDDFVYAAKEHPELAREDGRVLYVTFVNSSSYIPQLVEITLK